MSVTGTYAIVTKTPLGDQRGTFAIAVDGETFTGKISAEAGTMDVAGGRVIGNRLTWRMELAAPIPITLDCEATVEGDAITGWASAGVFGRFAMNGVRVA